MSLNRCPQAVPVNNLADLRQHELQPGMFEILGPVGGKGNKYGFVFVCPCGNCPGTTYVPIKLGEDDGSHWKWDGDKEQPTLHPSLQRTSDCRWHGWLKNGQFTEC